jgi:hypothetical protein
MDQLNARARLRVSFAAIFIGLLAGCGGGDDGGSPAAATAPSSAPSPGSTANTAPAVTGKPGTSVLSGRSYSFQPSATDANGDSLSFTATNVPSWASFSSTNGRLTGTPGTGDVGTYSGITITVSDGKATTSIGPFTISVTAVGTGSAVLSWTPPTQNSDGTALTNLAGYKILYGAGADELDQSIQVENSSVNTYVVENLTAGTWYFAVVAVNTSGSASSPSNVASKTIG